MQIPIRIFKDKSHRHTISIPANVWEYLELEEGDWLLVDIQLGKRGKKPDDTKTEEVS